MKTIVVYYSRKGSNKYLANRISKDLSCDIEEIRPRMNVFLLFLMNIHIGIRSIKHNLKDYERVILVGPIWVGRFIAPLKSFVIKYKNDISKFLFITCCGSTFDKKDEKFGHGLVFKEVNKIMGNKCKHCEAFPIELVVPDSQKDDDSAFMNTHLSDSNFKGVILERYIKLLTSLN